MASAPTRAPIELREMEPRRGGESGSDASGADDVHEAEAQVVLDSEMVSSGVVRATAARTSSPDSTGRASSGDASAQENETSFAGFPDIVLNERGPPLSMLLSRIFHASRLSLVFRCYHHVALQMIACANLDDTTPPKIAATYKLNRIGSYRQTPAAQELYPVPDYIEHWLNRRRLSLHRSRDPRSR